MTVCVATICRNINGPGWVVIGAADRMLTAGDVEFEPEHSKIAPLTSSVSVMMAGDAALQNEIFQAVQAVVQARVVAEQENWWLVRDVAELYLHHSQQALFKRAENSILKPLGLDMNTFISRQKEMDSDLVSLLSTRLQGFEMPSIETIVLGIDPVGAHIYLVERGEIRCQDAIGFASIGGGYWHANSQFMFAKHNFNRGFPESLLLTYSAKRRAEVAPGVGTGTDMIMIGPILGASTIIGEHVINKLAEVYSDTQKKTMMLDREAETAMSNYITEITKSALPHKQSANVLPPLTTEPPPPFSQSEPSGAPKETPL